MKDEKGGEMKGDTFDRQIEAPRKCLQALGQGAGESPERQEELSTALEELQVAEEALAETNELLETILDHTHMLVAYLDPQFNFARVNRAYAEADERDPSFFPGKNHFDLYPDAENEEIFRRVVETGEPYFVYAKPFEYAEHPGRGVTYWDWSLIPIKDPGEAVTGLVLTVVNVPERVQAEEQLKYHTVLLQTISDAVISTDLNFNILTWNKAAETMYGWQEDEVIGKRVDEATRVEWLYDDQEDATQQLFEQGFWKGEIVQHHKDGARINIRTSVSLIKDGAGNPIGVVAVNRDITERVRAEVKLKRSEERYALAQKVANVGSWDWDIQTGDLYWSEQIEPMFGFGHGEFGATYEAFLESVHHKDRQYVTDSVNACVEEGQDYDIEHRVVWPDGTVRWVSETGNVFRDEKGQAVRMLGIVQDITERKQAEEEVQSLARFPGENRNPVLRVSQDGTIRYANEASAPLLAMWASQVGQRLPDTWRQLTADALSSNKGLTSQVACGERIFSLDFAPVQEAGYVNLYGRDITEQVRAEEALQELAHNLNERVKELDCLYGISRLVQSPGISLEEILQGTIDLIPTAWQYPDITCARIVLEGQEFRTENLEESAWKQTADIVVHGERVGALEVYYLEKRPESGEGPFLGEERSLLNAIVERLGRIIEQKRAEELLREQNRFITTVFESLAHPFYVVDANDYTVKMANSAVCADEWPEPVTCYALTHRRDTPCEGMEHLCPVEEIKKTGKPAVTEHVHYDREGGRRIYEVHGHPILDNEGNVPQIIEYTLDVTDRVRAEEALRKAHDELERRVQMRTATLERAIDELVDLRDAERRQRQLAETLSTASLALTQTLNLDTVMNTLLDYLGRLVPYDSATVILPQDETRLAVRAVRGYERWTDPQEILAITIDAQASPPIHALLTTQKSILIPDTRTHPDWEHPAGAEHVLNWLGVPLVAGDKVIGLCGLDKIEPGFFTQQHIQLAEALVSQAAVVIQNAWLFEQVRAGRERLQSLSHRLVEVQETERRYIARELHDEAGQALTSLMVGLRLLEREAKRPEAIVAGVTELKRMVDGVIEDLHRLAMDLRPASLDHLGLVAALRQYVEAVSDKHGLVVQFETVGFDDRLPSDVETALYRIVQEALTNVIRHARATRVDVLLEQRGDKLIVIVEDNGVGFDPFAAMQSGRLGLFGMRERIEMLAGTLVLESAAGAGTTLLVEVPYGDSDTYRG